MLTLSRVALCRTCKCTHRHLTTDVTNVRQHLRALLRDTAQPVAVVTALMDPNTSHSHSPRAGPQRVSSAALPQHSSPIHFHGATLSSFSSISMDPHPLVAFSLRIPSRMATSLTSAHSSALAPSHMVINILSERQASTAVRFSRADLYPEPFADLPYTLTAEGLPVLDGSVGAMSCKLVAASWPLHELESLRGKGKGEKDKQAVWEGEGVASELFIAQVVRVERTLAEDDKARPLLYYRRGYVTTCDIDTNAGTKPLP